MIRCISMSRITTTIFMMFFFLLSAFGQTQENSLLVFVGEKIELRYIKPITESNDTNVIVKLDREYYAKYKILQLINGSYKSDTIEFTVYFHYGKKPEFSKYKTVLLFVSEYEGKLYHEKYQYFDLYMTESGRWASPYPVVDYNHSFKDSITVMPKKIPFVGKVYYSAKKMSADDIKEWFPQPYYRMEKKRAIAVYGNYVEDLFKLKQQTVLKARGIF